MDIKGFIIMKIMIRQLSDNDSWNDSFKLHFVINNMDNKTSTHHTGTVINKHPGLLYVNESSKYFVESFKFAGEIE